LQTSGKATSLLILQSALRLRDSPWALRAIFGLLGGYLGRYKKQRNAMRYFSIACFAVGIGVIFHGAFRKEFDWPRLLRERPIWRYRLCVVAIGAALAAIGGWGIFIPGGGR
jgi:hypothetical protein